MLFGWRIEDEVEKRGSCSRALKMAPASYFEIELSLGSVIQNINTTTDAVKKTQ
jgi:hypothetical protein